MRRSAWIAGAALLCGLVVACGGGVPTPAPSPGGLSAVEPTRPAPKVLATVRLGEEFRHGDLVLKCRSIHSGRVGGKRYGEYASSQMMYLRFTITNAGAGKIIEWPGWQGRGEAADEHGNVFKPVSISSWAWLPGNLPEYYDERPPYSLDGDTGTRLHPGKVYQQAAYYQFAPKTSTQATFTLPLGADLIRVSGPITHR